MPEWIPVIYEAFQRIAADEPTWSVARWLTERGLPRVNGKIGRWNERNVLTLIKCEVYRGIELHAKTKSVMKYITRTTKQEPAGADKIRHREMPHHRVVPDELWYRANRVIFERTKDPKPETGSDHPLYGIPRDSRGPLAKVFICGCCGHKMHQDGRNEGGYRCGNCRKNGSCWNRATAVRNEVHKNLSAAISALLLPLAETTDAVVSFVKLLYADEGRRQAAVVKLRADLRERTTGRDRLLRLAEQTDSPPESFMKRLAELECDVAEAQAELDALEHRRDDLGELTNETVAATLQAVSNKLLDMDREAGVLLARLIPNKIRAVPYQQFGSNKVVLRAEFELCLVNILPAQLVAALDEGAIPAAEWAEPISALVDLFTPSTVPTNAIWAAELRPFLRLKEIAELLGISKRGAHLAAELGDKMREAGITDPFIRLTEAPVAASRWRVHAKFVENGGAGGDAAQPDTSSKAEGEAA